MATINRDLSDAPAYTYVRQGVGSDHVAQGIQLATGLVNKVAETQKETRQQGALADYTSSMLNMEQQKAGLQEQIRSLNDQYLSNPNDPNAKNYLSLINQLRNSQEQGLKGVDTRMRAAQATFRTNNPSLVSWANSVDGVLLSKSTAGGSSDALTQAEKAAQEEQLEANKFGISVEEYRAFSAEGFELQARQQQAELAVARGEAGAEADLGEIFAASLKNEMVSQILKAAGDTGLTTEQVHSVFGEVELNWKRSVAEYKSTLRSRGIIITEDMEAVLEYPATYFDKLQDDVHGPAWIEATRSMAKGSSMTTAMNTMPLLANMSALFPDEQQYTSFVKNIPVMLEKIMYDKDGNANWEALRKLGTPEAVMFASYLDQYGAEEVVKQWHAVFTGQPPNRPATSYDKENNSYLTTQVATTASLSDEQTGYAVDSLVDNLMNGSGDFLAYVTGNPNKLNKMVTKNPELAKGIVNAAPAIGDKVLNDAAQRMREDKLTIDINPTGSGETFRVISTETGETVTPPYSVSKALRTLNNLATLHAKVSPEAVEQYKQETINTLVPDARFNAVNEELTQKQKSLNMWTNRLNNAKGLGKTDEYFGGREDAVAIKRATEAQQNIDRLNTEINSLNTELFRIQEEDISPKPTAEPVEESQVDNEKDKILKHILKKEGKSGDEVTSITTQEYGMTDAAIKEVDPEGTMSPEDRAVVYWNLMKSKWSKIKGFTEAPEGVQTALIDLSYNMGETSLGFSRLRAALATQDWRTALLNTLDTAKSEGKAVTGLALRRARLFNAAGVGTTISYVEVDEDGTITYIDSEGNEVLSYKAGDGVHENSSFGTKKVGN